MTAAHWHLMLNHIPLLGLLFGTGLLACGLWHGSEDVQTASLGLLAVAGLSVIVVYLTGEPAEEVVEGLAGVSHDALEAHEAWGGYGLLAGSATGVLALGAFLVGLVWERLARGVVVLTLIVAVLSSVLIGYTANLGGKISHPELRSETVSAVGDGGDAPSSTEPVEENENDEE